MKNILTFSLILILLLSLAACKNSAPSSTPQETTSSSQPAEVPKVSNCKLLVNGKDMAVDNYAFISHKHQYASIPLIAVVRALGADVKWESETNAVITYKENEYYLDTAKRSLTKKGADDINYLTPPAGMTVGVRGRTSEDEYTINSRIVAGFLQEFGVNIAIDYKASTITVQPS